MMVMILSVMFLGSVQPVMMVLSLMFITLFYSVYMYMEMMSFWFGYALIMIMLSGVFVIFTYMASLIPNEEFEIYGLIFFVIFMFICFLKMEVSESGDVYDIVSMNLWISWIGMFSLFLGMMLFSMMLLAVWVGCKNKGALRVN